MSQKGIDLDKINKTWFIDLKIKDENGSWRHIKKRGFKNKSAADYELRSFRNSKLIQVNLSKSPNIVLNLIKEWLNYRETKVRLTTLNNDKILTNKYLNKYFYYNLIDFISYSNLNSFKVNLIKEPFSINRKNKVLKMLKNIINFSFNKSYINSQVYKDCIFALGEIINNSDLSKEKNIWTKEEYKKFISTFSYEDKYRILFKFMFITGIRIGELCGLSVQDIDFETKQVFINKQASAKQGTGKSEVMVPKTKSSIRHIDLTEDLIKEIKEMLDSFPHQNKSFLFFCGDHPIGQTTIRSHFLNHCKIANVKNITIHGIRHTNCTWLMAGINNMEDVILISKRLGHSSTKQTLDTYSHVVSKKQKELLKIIDI